MDVAVGVHVLEQVLAGQVLAAPDDRRQAPVPQADVVTLPRLAREPEADLRPVDAGVAVRASS